MNPRLVLSVCMCVVGIGTAGADRRSREVAGPTHVYRELAPFDADGRHFLLFGNPGMVTQIHQHHVEEFIRRPGAGISRIAPRAAPSDWVELIPESLSDRHDPVTGGKTQPPKYDAPNETMTLPDGAKRSVRERVWLLHEQQLMSVNAEKGPAVYVLDAKAEHERMKEKKVATGKNTPTRKLDEFEVAALEQLREGNDVVMQSSEQDMRVVGAIRARKQCLECHQVQDGDMLGAFSYKLRLHSDATPPADCLKDTAGLSPADVEAVRFVESVGGKVVRTPNGPITEVYLTYSRNHVDKSKVKEKNKPNANFFSVLTRVHLKNSALRSLEAFPDLRVLDVTNSLVTDDGLKEIAKLQKLQKLCHTRNYITDTGIAELKRSLPQCEIECKAPPSIGPPEPSSAKPK